MRRFSNIVHICAQGDSWAAIAGIICSLLMITSTVLMFNVSMATPGDIDRDLLEKWFVFAYVVLKIVPFAGIAY